MNQINLQNLHVHPFPAMGSALKLTLNDSSLRPNHLKIINKKKKNNQLMFQKLFFVSCDK